MLITEFNIMEKKLILEKSQLLYSADFTTQQLESDFDITGGDWHVDAKGWLCGSMKVSGGGLIYTKKHYCGDILMDFYGRTVPPCDRDLNFSFCAKGWDFENNTADISYVAGLNGWWTGKTGLEKYPDLDLLATTSLHRFKAGQIYHIQAGRVGEFCFIFIDGVLAIELKDQNPIDNYGKVGFGVYASTAQFRDFKLYKPYSLPFATTYEEIEEQKGIKQTHRNS